MTQLHTIVAAQRQTHTRAQRELTELYEMAQRATTFQGGMTRFDSTKEDVDSEPAKTVLPRMTADHLLQRIEKVLQPAWDLGATRDLTNMAARADIVVGAEVLVGDVPVPTLLTLEKQLVHMRTIFAEMPVRDPSVRWTRDEGGAFYVSPEQVKSRTRKIVEGVVLYPHTEKFPAQVKETSRDEVTGHSVQVSFSGAISMQEKERLIDNLNGLIDAVRAARTVANQVDVVEFTPAHRLLSYVFAR